VNTGFTCIASILEGVKAPPASQGMQETLGVVGEQLRLLAHVVELARDDPAALPVVDAVAQDSFIKALASKIQAFEAALAHPAPAPTSDVAPDQATQGAALMTWLLQFNTAFRGVWTAGAWSLGEDLCKSISNLAPVSSKGPAGDDCHSQALGRLMAQEDKSTGMSTAIARRGGRGWFGWRTSGGPSRLTGGGGSA
jgi:mediator of RNA polymerase II transcription subunit 12